MITSLWLRETYYVNYLRRREQVKVMRLKNGYATNSSEGVELNGFRKSKQTLSGQLLNTFQAMALISLMPFLILLSAIRALGYAIIFPQSGRQLFLNENQNTEKKKIFSPYHK